MLYECGDILHKFNSLRGTLFGQVRELQRLVLDEGTSLVIRSLRTLNRRNTYSLREGELAIEVSAIIHLLKLLKDQVLCGGSNLVNPWLQSLHRVNPRRDLPLKIFPEYAR